MVRNQNVFDDPKDDLNFKDSWLNTTVEMAALGTILAGAGTLAVKGDFSDGIRTGKQAIGAMGKGFENYINRKGSIGSKFGYQVGKRTFRNLAKSPSTKTTGHELLSARVNRTRAQVENDPATQEKIRNIIAKKLSQRYERNHIDNVLDGSRKPTDQKEDEVRYLYEKLVSEEVNKKTGVKPAFENKRKSPRTKNDKPLFDRRELVKNTTSSGLAGVAFGGGISGFHAIDRLSGNPDTQKKLEDSFQYGGSFLPREDDKRMDKRAGSLETYNKLKHLGNKTPEAVATGLGFTGVSLGAAALLNKKKEQKEKETPDDKRTRVIIELGDQDDDPQQNLGQHPSLASLPKLSSQESSYLEKRAFPSPDKSRLGNFLQDFRGHGKEIERLQAINPADQAAEQLRDANVQDLVKQQYGNLVNDKTEANFTNSLFQRQTDEAQKAINDQIKDLETQTADARLKGGAGALLAGGGLAALGTRPKQEDSNDQIPE